MDMDIHMIQNRVTVGEKLTHVIKHFSKSIRINLKTVVQFLKQLNYSLSDCSLIDSNCNSCFETIDDGCHDSNVNCSTGYVPNEYGVCEGKKYIFK